MRYSALKGGAFNSPKFSADGKYVAVLGRDYRISIFEVASGAYVCKSDSSTNCFAWSPDGMTIVITRSRQDNYDSLTGKKTMVYFLQFYNASNGKFEREIKVKNPIYDMLYSKQGNMIIALPNNVTDSIYIEFINPINGELIRQSNIKRKWGSDMYLDKEKSRIVIIERLYKPSGLVFGLVVLNAETGDFINFINLPSLKHFKYFQLIRNTDLGFIMQSQGFNPGDSLFYLINILDGSIVREFPGMKQSIIGIDVTHDGNYLITNDFLNDVFIWDVNSGQIQYVWHKSRSILSIALSPDGRYIAGLGSIDSIALWPMPQISDAPTTGEGMADKKIRCRPNPARNEITVEWHGIAGESNHLSIMNMVGQEIKRINGAEVESSGKITVDVSDLPTGQYVVVLQSESRQWINPFIIER